jgi:hypothetical protein
MHIKLIPLLYLDPGSGSMILQIVIAAVLGGAYAVKVYWKKIKRFLGGKNAVDDTEELAQMTEEQPQEDDVK